MNDGSDKSPLNHIFEYLVFTLAIKHRGLTSNPIASSPKIFDSTKVVPLPKKLSNTGSFFFENTEIR